MWIGRRVTGAFDLRISCEILITLQLVSLLLL